MRGRSLKWFLLSLVCLAACTLPLAFRQPMAGKKATATADSAAANQTGDRANPPDRQERIHRAHGVASPAASQRAHQQKQVRIPPQQHEPVGGPVAAQRPRHSAGKRAGGHRAARVLFCPGALARPRRPGQLHRPGAPAAGQRVPQTSGGRGRDHRFLHTEQRLPGPRFSGRRTTVGCGRTNPNRSALRACTTN